MYYKTPFGVFWQSCGKYLAFSESKVEIFFNLFLTNVLIFFSLAFMNEIGIIYMNISNYFPHFRMVHDPERFIFTNNPD